MVMRGGVCGSLQESHHSSFVEEWVGGGHQIRQLLYLCACLSIFSSPKQTSRCGPFIYAIISAASSENCCKMILLVFFGI